jgi:LEA14-like dessication related protein
MAFAWASASVQQQCFPRYDPFAGIMKKFLFILLIILLASGLLFFALFYFKPKFVQNIFIPEIDQVERIDISLSDDTAYSAIHLFLKNKGPFRINIDSIEYHVNFDTLRVLSRKQDMQLTIGAGENDTLVLPINLPYKRLLERIVELQERDSADITTEARVVYHTVFGRHGLPHKKTSRIGMPRPPRFELERLKLRGFAQGMVLLEADLKMYNPSNLELLISDIGFDLSLADVLQANGELDGRIEVKPRSSVTRTIPIRAKLRKPLKVVMSLIGKKEILPYHLSIHGFAQAEKLGEERTRITIEKKGTMEFGPDLLKSAVKASRN